MSKSTVYFTNELTPEAVVKMYKQLGVELPGKVAVKVHSGEDGNQNYLHPEFMKPVIDAVHGTVVECNTAYGGARNETPKHIELMKKHRWSDLFDVDIMDAEGPDVEWPVENGKVLKVNYLGKNIENYDSMLVLIHFKGHPMGGYGGALKQLSIGCASSAGKTYIHSGGKVKDQAVLWENICPQDTFLEAMADAAVADGQPVGGALAIDDFIRIGIAHVARIDHRLRSAGSHEHELRGLGRNRSVGLLTELREFVVGRRTVGRSDRDDHRAAILRVGLQHQFDAVRREIVARAAGRLLEDRRHGRPAHRRPYGRGRNGGLPRHIRNRRPDVDGHGRNEALVPRCGGAVGIEKFHVGIERDPRRGVEAIGAVVVARHRNEQDRTDPCRCFYRRFHVPVELDVYQYQPSVCVRFEFLSRADFEIGHRRMFVLFRFAAR